jgi:flagellar basal-body rod modification protein FlgD
MMRFVVGALFMAISNVANTSSASSTPSSSASSASGTLNQQQFLQLLTAQLKAQDPLNPVSATDFTSQLAQLNTVSGLQQLNTSIQQMLQLQQLGQGAALMGKTVTYTGTGSSSSGQGVVQGITVQNGQLQVQVGGQAVPIGQITGILQS